MTSETANGGRDSEVRVAEYVLGVLDAREHDAMAKRIAENPALQAEAQFWQQRLASLDEGFAEVTPPPQILKKVEGRLFGSTAYTGPFATIWNSVALWRGVAAAGLMAAIIAVGLGVMQPQLEPGTLQLAATLSAQDSDVSFLALYDSEKGAVRLAGLSGAPVPGKAYELWFIQGDTAPQSLGLVPVDGRVEVVLSDAMKAEMGAGTVLAVTLEPETGAPGGVASGPIVAAGSVSAI